MEKFRVISTSHRGIVYENRKDFSDSIFQQVYKRAYLQVQESVLLQLSKKNNSKRNEDSDNLITFIGRRGTGKSSAMLSFMNALCENYLKEQTIEEYAIYEDRSCNKLVRFVSIDEIDASMLEKGEDIFEVILAKMFKEFLKKIDRNSSETLSYKMRELHNKFASIYKKHLNVKANNTANSHSAEAAISGLRDLARSVDIREEFQELVYSYIEIIQEKSYEKQETFLVVAIDDLDMNVESGFEILEKIQRYLKINRLLVLLAVNYEQMKACCQKHFSKAYDDYSHILMNESKEFVREKINNLAEQYMEKALPPYARIYLPSLKTKDYDRSRVMKIKMIINNMEYCCSTKKAIFLLLVRKTMVRYDVMGLKRHFMEPESLRKLNDFWIFRENMQDLPEKKDNQFLSILDFNYRRSMDDVLFRFTDEILSDREAKFFLELSEMDIRQRGEAIVLDFLKRIANNSSQKMNYTVVNNEKTYHMFENDYTVFKYSYGELMRALYFMGREDFYEKKMVWAILAMYSLVLTKIFYRCMCGSAEQKERNYKMMKTLISGSVAGSWSRYMMPCLDKTSAIVGTQDITKHYYTGSAKDILLSNHFSEVSVTISVSQDTAHKINSLYIKQKNGQKPSMDDMVEVVNSLYKQFALMLFLNIRDDFGFDYLLPVVSQEDINAVHSKADKFKSTEKAEIKFNKGWADYNILNFINNIFTYDEILRKFTIAVYYMCLDEDSFTEEDVEKIIKNLKNTSGSFFKDMENWRKNSGDAVVPFYSTDLFYNLLKRLVRKQRLSLKDTITKDELYMYLEGILNDIEEALSKNDSWYLENKKWNFVEKFGYIFKNCPVIKVFRGEEYTKIKVRKKINSSEFQMLFNDFILQIIENENNHKNDDHIRLASLFAI